MAQNVYADQPKSLHEDGFDNINLRENNYDNDNSTIENSKAAKLKTKKGSNGSNKDCSTTDTIETHCANFGANTIRRSAVPAEDTGLYEEIQTHKQTHLSKLKKNGQCHDTKSKVDTICNNAKAWKTLTTVAVLVVVYGFGIVLITYKTFGLASSKTRVLSYPKNISTVDHPGLKNQSTHKRNWSVTWAPKISAYNFSAYLTSELNLTQTFSLPAMYSKGIFLINNNIWLELNQTIKIYSKSGALIKSNAVNIPIKQKQQIKMYSSKPMMDFMLSREKL